MTLTKDDIVEAITGETVFHKSKAVELIETLLELIKHCLSSGEDLLISGFGKFSVKEKRERRGRNPATGEDMMLKSRRVVKFHCSGNLRKKINQ